MRYLTGTPIPYSGGEISWQYTSDDAWNQEQGVRVGFSLNSFDRPYRRRDAIRLVRDTLDERSVDWMSPGATRWAFDLDKLKAAVPELHTFPWLRGTIALEPEVESAERDVFGRPSYEALVAFYVVPEVMEELSPISEPPDAIRDSLARFKQDHPNPARAAFIMMQFSRTRSHGEIVEAIRATCSARGITALRADEREYSDDLFPNVLTYMHGCGFGIAVFERLLRDDFNPNVSLEVGYMLAMGKPVCLLKDRTLTTLQSDLVGRLYKSFDTQDPGGSIPGELQKWLEDRNLIEQTKPAGGNEPD